MSELAAHRERALTEFAEARAAGLDCWLEILPPGPPWPCSAASGQVGARYGHNDLPSLPLPGCDRAKYGCACCYATTLPQEPQRPAAEVARDFDKALAALPPSMAKRVRGMYEQAVRSWGIKP